MHNISSVPDTYTVLDVETTTHNKGHPFDPRNKLISYAFKSANSSCHFKYFNDPDFLDRRRLDQVSGCIVGFNFKFDCQWLFASGCQSLVWDCQLAEHVYTGQQAQFISLNECLERYGLETKKDLVKEYWGAGVQTDEVPVAILQEYNEWDVIQTEKLFLVQQELLSDEQKRLVYLMGEDLKVLASIEAAGFLFDTKGASVALADYQQQVAEIETGLNSRLPVIQHGTFNWDSGDHLSCFLYGGTLNFDYATSCPATYKSGARKGEDYVKNSWHVETITFPGYFKPLENTEIKKTKDNPLATTRLYQIDGPTLSSLKGGKESKEIVACLQARSEKQKLVEMLESLFKLFETKQWENNYVHGQYNQNVAITGRLSSSMPNMQNFPPELDVFFVSRYD